MTIFILSPSKHYRGRQQDRGGANAVVRAGPDRALLRPGEGALSGDQQGDARQLLLSSHEWHLHQVRNIVKYILF